MEVDSNQEEQIGNGSLDQKEEIEVEDEELLVYVNFEDLHDDLSNTDLNIFQALGLDSAEPIIQIGDKTFGGNWKETVGTAVFFEETHLAPKRCYFSSDVPKPLQYIAKTQKCLNLRRVFISSKDETSNSKLDSNNEIVIDSTKIAEIDEHVTGVKED